MIARLVTLAADITYRFHRQLFITGYIAEGEIARLKVERETYFALGQRDGYVTGYFAGWSAATRGKTDA